MSSFLRLLVFCFVLFECIDAQVPTYVPTNGLVGWWGFNGNANDASGNNNHGFVSGAVLSNDRFNQINSAYQFDGIDDEIRISSLTNYQYSPITYSIWIYLPSYDKIDDYPPSGGVVLIGRDSCGYENEGALMIYNQSNLLNKITYYTGGSGSNTNYTPELNTWIHLVLTIDGLNNIKFYKNGELIFSEVKQLVSFNNIMFKIGAGSWSGFCSKNGPRFTYEGRLDDVGVWNRALTQSEITTLFQSIIPVTASASTVSNVSCFNGNDGSATVTPNGGTPPYSYSWNTTPVQSTQTATALKAGVYTVTVTDSKGVFSTANATITQPAVLSNIIANTVSNVSCFGKNDGIVTVSNPSGGTPPYAYSWNTNPVQTTQTVSNLPAGIYTVIVTDAKGCSSSSTATVTQPLAISNVISSTLTNVGCFGGNNGSATVTNPTGGTPPYTYQWNTNPLQVTQTAFNLFAGTYMVTVTDSKGCTATSSVTITQPAQPLSNVIGQTIQHAKCNGSSTGSVTVSNPIGGTPPYTYKWNSVPEQKTQIATNLSAGTYSVTVTDFNGCTATSFATVNEPTKVTNVQASVVKNISCYGLSDGSAKVSDPRGGTPPYTYQWNTVPVQNTQTVTNLKAGEYVVVVSDANGCIAQSLITITQPNAPLAIGNAKVDKQVSCFGESDGSVSVPNPTGGTAPYTIAWNTNPVQKTYSISNLKAGTYTAIITDANGCSVSTSATVTEPSQVVVFSPKDTTVLIQTDAFMKAGTNNPISTYQWQTNTGTGFSNLQNIFQYSGVTTNTLRIENCTTSNHNQPFRCIISTNGCLDTSAIAVLAVRTNVGVKGDDQKLIFTISPNPTGESDQFLVRFTEIPNQDVSIELIDILGSVHYSNTLQAGSETCIIPVQGLSSGMYMLRVRMNNEVFIEKVIVN